MTTSRFRKATSLATIGAFGWTCLISDGAQARTRPATAGQEQVVPAPTPGPASGRTTPLQIEHDPLVCVTTDAAPVVEAKIQPGPDYANSYVYWRKAGEPYYYYTVMQGPAVDVKGVIPRPLPETKTIDYYVLARDTKAVTKQTPEYAPPVVQDNVCKDERKLAVGAAGAGLTIGLTNENQSPIPPGFNKADIAKVILVSGAVVGVGAAAAATSGTGTGSTGASTAAAAGAAGGISTGVIVAGAAVAAAGIGYGISQGLKSDTPTFTPTHTPTRTPTPTPVPNQFIEVEATWSGPGQITDVQLRKDGSAVPGQPLQAGCGTGSRTWRFVAQGVNASTGVYSVIVTGATCVGQLDPGQIAALVTVQSHQGQKCSGIVRVPTSGGPSSPNPACVFSIQQP